MDKVFIEYNSPCGIFFQHRILDRDYVVRFSSHAQYEFVFLIQGKMELIMEGESITVNAGDMALIDVNKLHSQRMFKDVETELMVVNFSPDIFPHFIELAFFKLSDGNPLLKNVLPASICKRYKFFSFFKNISGILLKENVTHKAPLIYAEIIKLITAVNVAVDKLVGSMEYKVKKKGFVLQDCLNFINANISKRLSIDEIANAMYVSRPYLQHAFKREMNMSISEYITSQKMTVAKSLLERNYRPMEVAEKLGYENYPTFRIKYKKFFGIVPSAVGMSKFTQGRVLEK